VFDETKLIEGCKKCNPIAQKELYDKYNKFILGLCYRYTGDIAYAEDLMQDILIKVITKISNFNNLGNGSLNAWIKRIAINTCITSLNKKNKYHHVALVSVANEEVEMIDDESPFDELDFSGTNDNSSTMEMALMADFSEKELLEILTQIPEPFRNVFNLFIIEEYKHEEIAQLLNINIKTSRTRLLRARKLIREKIHQFSVEKILM
jgi:RNA polymerase sigma-70 factor, ECF subfamily